MPQNKIFDYFGHKGGASIDGPQGREYSSESERRPERRLQRPRSSGEGSRGEVSRRGQGERGQARQPGQKTARDRRRELAQETLGIITTGALRLHASRVNYSIFDACLASAQATEFFADDSSLLSNWEELSPKALRESGEPRIPADFGIFNRTTLSAARELRAAHPTSKTERIGILNFASATKPGGGFLTGAEAQEESLARSSSLYTALTSPGALPFYNVHSSTDTDGFYTHSMIYSPGVVVFRDDAGELIEPYTIDVVTSPAVNAGVVRQRLDYEETEALIESTMAERMARILFLFQSRNCKYLVLGSFGTGVFQNSVSMVAAAWAELLVLPHSKFFAVFKRIEFAVLGEATYNEFRAAFEAKILNKPVPK